MGNLVDRLEGPFEEMKARVDKIRLLHTLSENQANALAERSQGASHSPKPDGESPR